MIWKCFVAVVLVRSFIEVKSTQHKSKHLEVNNLVA